MDRLTILKRFPSIVLLGLLATNCMSSKVEFIYLDDALKNYSDTSQYAPADLVHFMYLDFEIAQRISRIHPDLLIKRHRSLSDFKIDERDKTLIKLEKDYSRIEEVTERLEAGIIHVLKSKFGITNPKNDQEHRVLVYKNSAYIEFTGRSSTHAITFELQKNNQLVIGLAFVIVE